MDIKALIAPLRKWWWLLIAAAVLAAMTSLVAVSQQPDYYLSRATLMTGRTIDDPNPTSPQFYLSQQLAQSYADLAQREPVRDAVKQALGLERLPEYFVRALPNTQLIEVSVVDTQPTRAQAVAAALAAQLIRMSPANQQQEDGSRQEFINQQLDDLQVQIENTREEIADLQGVLGDLFSAREIAETQSAIAALQAKLNTLQANYAALLSSSQEGATNALTLIEPAYLPDTPIDPQAEMTILTAAAIGLMLACAAAYLLEYLDDSIKSRDEAEKISSVPVLGSIGHIKGSEEATSRLVTLQHPRSPLAESFRALRTGVQFSTVGAESRTLLFTSPSPGDGKSVSAANLSIVMAQANYRVLLIDADLRRPSQHKMFDVGNTFGLTSLLLLMDKSRKKSDREPLAGLLASTVQQTAEPNLSLLTSGPIPPNPSELLGSPRMRELMSCLAESYDFVILDSPPCLAVTDSVVLSTMVDQVVIVMRIRHTRRNELKQALEKLRSVNAHIGGLILNRLSAREAGYYYQRGYYSETTEAEQADRHIFNGVPLLRKGKQQPVPSDEPG